MAYEVATVTGHYAFVERIRQVALLNGWVVERYDDTVLNAEGQINLEMILRGEGLSGTEQIWVAITTYQSANSDYYNISLSSMIGYVPGNTLANQPGWSGYRWIPMWNQSIPYWLVINAQRITFGAKVETHYVNGYAGKFFAYKTPGQFPYPICVLGTSIASTGRYSDAWSCDCTGGMKYRNLTGTWASPKSIPYEIPTGFGDYYKKVASFVELPPRDTGGEYPVYPITMHDATYGAVGDLDGLYFVPGFNSAGENIVQADAVDHIKLSDNQGTGFMSYYCLRLA